MITMTPFELCSVACLFAEMSLGGCFASLYLFIQEDL
jgi:hypothetical protein